MSLSVQRSNAEHYHGDTITEVRQYPAYARLLPAQPGRPQIADVVLEWTSWQRGARTAVDRLRHARGLTRGVWPSAIFFIGRGGVGTGQTRPDNRPFNGSKFFMPFPRAPTTHGRPIPVERLVTAIG
jgi:hypothetical protein